MQFSASATEDLNLLVDDREACELMRTFAFIGARHGFLKGRHRLLGDADVHAHLHDLVGHAVERMIVLLALGLVLQPPGCASEPRPCSSRIHATG
jgi:hypothetical protein